MEKQPCSANARRAKEVAAALKQAKADVELRGYGTVRFDTGDVYEGQIHGGYMHGAGIYTFIDGTSYSGQVQFCFIFEFSRWDLDHPLRAICVTVPSCKGSV